MATGAPVLKDKRMVAYNLCHQLVQTEEYHEGGKWATQMRIWGWIQLFLGQPVAHPSPSFDSSHDCGPILAAVGVAQSLQPSAQHARTSHPHTQGADALAGHRGHRDCHGAVATGASRGSRSQPHGCGSSVARTPRTAPVATPAAAAAAAPATHDFVGVSYKGNANTHGAKWQASASVRGGTQSLGCFSTAEAAAEAYDRCIVSERRLGVGRTNFPLSNYLSIFNSASLPVLYS